MELKIMPNHNTKYSKHIIGSAVVFILCVVVAVFVFTPKLSVGLIQAECLTCDNVSAIKIASQIGRLDVISLALGFVGIGVGFFAIFSFFAVKDEACDIAVKESAKFLLESRGEITRQINDQVKLQVIKALQDKNLIFGMKDVPSQDVDEEVNNEY
jgi:hypothetical protein